MKTKLNRRNLLKGVGGLVSLPFLESIAWGAKSDSSPPLRLLIVGNPYGAHPDYFFPKSFGKRFEMPLTLKSLSWLKDRITIVSHTDHGMVSGHGREVSFLSGVLPAEAQAFPEKNMSLDQIIARRIGAEVRYQSVGAALDGGIRMSWSANGTEHMPITDPHALFDHMFLNLTKTQKKNKHQAFDQNKSILDTVGGQFDQILNGASSRDRDRMEQFQSSIRDLEKSLSDRKTWIERDKPDFDISNHFNGEVTIKNKYEAIFDMISYGFQTDLTRVATVAFSSDVKYVELPDVNRSYHGCTHNGKREDVTSELVAIESFQIECLSRCLKKLDAIKEPGSNGSLLDHTVVLFGSGMGYGGTHSNRDLPILVAGGGFKHLGHVDARNTSGKNMPLCNLYVALMQRFGIERDRFNTSTGIFDLKAT